MPEGTPERRGPLAVSFDLRSLLMVIGLLGPLVAIITGVLQNRQDVRSNTVRMNGFETRLQALEEKGRKGDDMVLRYCIARREAGDSSRVRLPDIGC